MMTVLASGARLTAAAEPNFEQHTHRLGLLPELPIGALSDLLRDAGLTGRGGAGFPAGAKLSAIQGDRAVVIGNGAEGEPLSGKDSWLLENAPHLVLDGLNLVADDVRAADRYLYVPACSTGILQAAVADRRTAGVPERTRIVTAPDTFLAGERSAAVNRVEGKPALPRTRFESTTSRGVNGRPTVVSNVETLAHIALIARYGPRWFRAVGAATDPGTMLVTLSGALTGGVVEVVAGTSLSDILTHGGQVDPRELSAALLGGYHGRWIPQRAFHETRIGRNSGTGIVYAIAPGDCGLTRTARILDYLAAESAGQCGPCINGLPRLARLMQDLANGDDVRNEILRLAALVDGRGACHHPDGAARLARSAIEALT